MCVEERGCSCGLHIRITNVILVIQFDQNHRCSFTVSSGTSKVIGYIGRNVTLPCSYDKQPQDDLHFCWGRGKVPVSKCSNTILSFPDESSQSSSRYQLLGRTADGDLSLTIMNAQRSDAGVYGCRVEIPGWFNDQKVNIRLIMEEGNAQNIISRVCDVFQLS